MASRRSPSGPWPWPLSAHARTVRVPDPGGTRARNPVVFFVRPVRIVAAGKSEGAREWVNVMARLGPRTRVVREAVDGSMVLWK